MPRTKSSKQAADSAVETKSGEEQDAGGSCRLPAGGGWKARVKGGEVVGLEWSRSVQVPLRKCDYQIPIIARACPFQQDLPEDELAFGLAAALLLYVPVWRGFKRWSIMELNGLRGYRATPEGYAEVRRLLIEFGYSEKEFEQASWAGIEALLRAGVCRRDTAELLREDIADGKGSDSKSVRVPTPPNEVWSRVMSRRDITDRLLKSPDKWRTLMKVYGNQLRQIGGKGSRNWQMRLDGLPENLVKEMNRP